jgi:hypothetical protein
MRSNSDSLEALKQAQIAIERTNESIIVATSDPRKVSFAKKRREETARAGHALRFIQKA